MENKIGTSSNSSQPEWSGDWYVFSNAEIQGPFSATQTFSMESRDAQGKPVLISKKGFTQWYGLNEIAEIFKVTKDLGLRVESEKAALVQQQMIANAIESRKQKSSLSQQEANPHGITSKIVKKQVGPLKPTDPINPINKGMGASIQVMAAAESLETKQPEVTSPKIDEPQTNESYQQPGKSPLYRSPLTTKSKVERSKKDLLQEYFFVRGRLRLGKIRSPWASAFFGLPLSLGFLWPFWMGTLLKEIFYHSASRVNFPKSVVFMGLIPGLHFYAVFRLAQLVREMEMQNKYKSVSPHLAAVFSLFPPFAMAYLQDAANRHWLLHARHACSQKG